ncbi:MAG: zinc ABC transporter substrate-binding protein, partial [Alphaproteobacteria bacterium]|nr:zinc ABC transporter substrate-binding protein [Alphaproteobacteria bacterium]
MKRTALAAVLVAALLSPAAAEAEVRILACEPEWAALAKEIGGDDVVVHSATHGRQDAHYIR